MRLAFALALALVGSTSLASAQSLIVGIPSADVTPRGRFALTHESQALVLQRPVSWNSFTFVTYGLSDRVEASVSLLNLSAPAYGELVLGAGFKYVHPLFAQSAPDWELRLTLGQVSLFSLERSAVGGWGFAHVSARLPGLRTRLTAGASLGSELLFGPGNTPWSAMAGLEQPLLPWLSLVADWYSGTHALAAFIPAVQLNLHPVTLIVGYKRDNVRADARDGFLVEAMVEL